MKIIVINYEDRYIEVVPLTSDEQTRTNDEGEIKAASILSERGFDINNIRLSWMVVDSDCPVFWYGETVPIINL